MDNKKLRVQHEENKSIVEIYHPCDSRTVIRNIF